MLYFQLPSSELVNSMVNLQNRVSARFFCAKIILFLVFWEGIIKFLFTKTIYKNNFKICCFVLKILKFSLKIPYCVKYLNVKIKENTFLLWEPCTESHGEIIPGFAKYLLDLGYEVSVLMNPKRRKEGLFCKFSHPKLFFNNLELDEIIYYLSKNGLKSLNILNNMGKTAKRAKGIIITTARNVSLENSKYEDRTSFFKPDDSVFLVEHDVKWPIDNAFWRDDIITLAPIDYKKQKSIVVNPHYFGTFDLKNTKTKNNIKNLIIIGTLDCKRRNFSQLFNTLDEIVNNEAKSCCNFKITVIGSGDYNIIPKHLRKFFDIKGRLDFKNMYQNILNSDFILPLLDENIDAHKRYITTGTSGAFQLSFGFNKPCIISEKFAIFRFLNANNTVIYAENNLKNGILNALNMSKEEYFKMCVNLKNDTNKIYEESLRNLKFLIEG